MLHWIVGEVAPPHLEFAMQADDASLRREQERLLYVACTRARDLLVLTELPGAPMNSWARIVDLEQHKLPRFDTAKPLAATSPVPCAEIPNLQTREVFDSESAAIAARATRLTWVRPSDHDADRMPVGELVAVKPGDPPETDLPVGAGRIRGLVLHKPIEEILTGEVEETPSALASRAGMLMPQLATADGAILPDRDEIAATALRALRLPGIIELRSALVSELTLFSSTA
jgi:ATP-dependent exoDNAse (exonuclease V) beta subunit